MGYFLKRASKNEKFRFVLTEYDSLSNSGLVPFLKNFNTPYSGYSKMRVKLAISLKIYPLFHKKLCSAAQRENTDRHVLYKM